MKIRIIGDAAAAAVLTGMLAAEQHEVTWNPEAEVDPRTYIRLNLPWGWVRAQGFRISTSSLLKTGEIGVLARRKAGEPNALGSVGRKNGILLVLDCDSGPGEMERRIVPGTTILHGISLLEAMEWEPGIVELSSSQPVLIVEGGGYLGEFLRCLKAGRFLVREVEDLVPYRNALHIRDLLSLPVALCHSTVSHFLSYPEGREIAVCLMEEGLRLYSHKGLPLQKLPDRDPRELLQKLNKKPREFDRFRNRPDRAYGNTLQLLLAGEVKTARDPHDRIVRMSAQTGVDPRWNWAIAQRANHAVRVGFYRDPVELYNALR
jgi:hypothetical protein